MDGSFLVLGVGTDTGAGWAAVREDAHRVMSALQPWATESAYLLMADEEVDERRGWPAASWQRLAALRAAADPHGLFVPRTLGDSRSADPPGSSQAQGRLKVPGPPWWTPATTTRRNTMTEHDTRTDRSRPSRPSRSWTPARPAPSPSPATTAYDALVSPWNVAIPVRPAAVVAAQTAQDVVEAVRFAARHDLHVTPQATGHGPMAELLTELLVTTQGLDECVVHPEGWARVGAGVKWLRVVEAAAPHGLAPLSGSITDVGIVGYTTGGGLGPMARTYGMAIDQVRAIEVVTGDGELRRVTPTEHPELFFALRGAKGMLGIVTAIEFDLVHQPTFYGGSLWFDGDDAAAVIEQWLHWSEDLPELATTSIALFQLPAMPDVPPPLADRLTLSVRYVWTGDPEEGERRFAEIREAAPVLLDDVALKPYTAIDSVAHRPAGPDAGARGGRRAHRLPGRGRRGHARPDRARLGVTAGPGGGAPDGWGDRACRRAPERLLLAGRGVLPAPGRHRGGARGGGAR